MGLKSRPVLVVCLSALITLLNDLDHFMSPDEFADICALETELAWHNANGLHALFWLCESGPSPETFES